MERFFNTAGPVESDRHYCLDPLTRLDWEEIQTLIEDRKYFVLHAPRQTGKTSTLLAMMKTLNEKGHHACAYANIEAAQAARGDAGQGIPTACSVIARSLALHLAKPELDAWYRKEGQGIEPQDRLSQLLAH